MAITELENFIGEHTDREEYSRLYKEYIQKIARNNVPVIFEIEHLGKLLGLETLIVARMVASPRSFYRDFTIPKARGGYRQITTPYPSLMMAQRWIAQNVLNKIEVNDASHGFVRGKSIITNAKMHAGASSILKCDIQDFFPSVKFPQVMGIFGALGYSFDVKYFLSRLCTLGNELPQGAPTSPALSNVIVRRMDFRLRALAESVGLTYTRYADDLTFSGERIGVSFSKIVSRIVREEGFSLNTEKTKLIRGGGRRIVTGLSVAHDMIRVPRPTKRKIRQEVHLLLRNGVEQQSRTDGKIDLLYIDRVVGRLAFWRSVEPNNPFVQRYWPVLTELQRATPTEQNSQLARR